jgi:hypothetical protein
LRKDTSLCPHGVCIHAHLTGYSFHHPTKKQLYDIDFLSKKTTKANAVSVLFGHVGSILGTSAQSAMEERVAHH